MSVCLQVAYEINVIIYLIKCMHYLNFKEDKTMPVLLLGGFEFLGEKRNKNLGEKSTHFNLKK